MLSLVIQRTLGQHRPVMVNKGKGRGDMHILTPGMVRNHGPHLDQTLDQPVDGPFHFFAPYIELPDPGPN